MKGLHMIAWILVIIGGINWLLFGIFGQELGYWILGGMDSLLARIVYILVGIAAIIELFTHRKDCGKCAAKKSAPAAMPNQGGGNMGNM